MEKVKDYSLVGLTLIWKAMLCPHSGIGEKRLPEAYHPKQRPGMEPERATATALGDPIGPCPCGVRTLRENTGDHG